MNSKSIVDAIQEHQRELKEQQKQEAENLKLACKELFNNPNGKFFLQYIKSVCGWNDQDNNINPELLIYKKGKRDIWTVIRNALPRDIVAQIEVYDA